MFTIRRISRKFGCFGDEVDRKLASMTYAYEVTFSVTKVMYFSVKICATVASIEKNSFILEARTITSY